MLPIYSNYSNYSKNSKNLYINKIKTGNIGIGRGRRRVTNITCGYSLGPALIGSMAAFTTTYPLDTYKTLIQTNSKTEEINFFQGYAPGVCVCCMNASVYFIVLSNMLHHLPLVPASMISTVCSCCLKVPGKAITKLLQNGDFSNIKEASVFLYDNYGLIGFFRGFFPYIIDDVPQTALKFFLYDFFGKLYPSNPFLTGICTGLISSILTQPFDVLQTKILCNTSTKTLDYKNLNYFSGLTMTLIINSVQSIVFFNIHSIIKALQLFPV
jgi:hypothetical protein